VELLRHAAGLKQALSHIGMVQEDKIADVRATSFVVIRLLAY